MAASELLTDAVSDSFLQTASLYLLQNVPGFPPIIQTVHILGIAAVMASIMMINLRLLGIAVPSQNISEMTQRLLPWFWSALAVNLVSGAVFVLARPARYFNNPVFAWKFAFLVPAVLLVALFHYYSRRHTDFWISNAQRSNSGKLLAIFSIILWVMVIMAGRWIAYSEYLFYPEEFY